MPIASLPHRAVLSVVGADARGFLQNLVTCDVEALSPGSAAYGGLLTPQGKILFDFLIACVDAETFWLDTARSNVPALVKRLAMYRLRAKVAIADVPTNVFAVWGDARADGVCFVDPRAPDLGSRMYGDVAVPPGDALAYDAHRIALGVPEGGVDFVWGDAFPHEANMDLHGGVAFDKGCYVGQEVVSRMHHRGTNRRRILRASFDGAPPALGAEIRAGDSLIGTLGSTSAGCALAAVRTDRLQDATTAGLVPIAGDVALRFLDLP